MKPLGPRYAIMHAAKSFELRNGLPLKVVWFGEVHGITSLPNLDQMTPDQLLAFAAQLLSQVETVGKTVLRTISSEEDNCENLTIAITSSNRKPRRSSILKIKRAERHHSRVYQIPSKLITRRSNARRQKCTMIHDRYLF